LQSGGSYITNKTSDASPLDLLRAATLGRPIEYRKTSVEANGQTFEIREPSEKRRRSIYKQARGKMEATEAGGVSLDLDVAELRVWCCIEMVFIPETDTPVFGKGDRDVLMNQPTTRGWFKDLADKAMAMFQGEDEDDELDAGKSDAEKPPS
jgi:hypothetical protein